MAVCSLPFGAHSTFTPTAGASWGSIRRNSSRLFPEIPGRIISYPEGTADTLRRALLTAGVVLYMIPTWFQES